MKTPNCIVCFITLALLLSCRKSIKSCEQVEGRSVLLINKTPHKKSATKTLLINDKEFLDNMCSVLFEYRKRITDVNVRDNRGFIEVVFSKDRKIYFDMTYTDYDGTVFWMGTDEYYKNDSLVSLLESKFILKD